MMQTLELNPETPPILVIEDDPGHLRSLADILETEGLQPICCQTGQEALSACKQSDVHVAILDLRLRDIDGLQLLTQLLRKHPSLKVIIHTGYASLDTAMAAINHGAFAYVEKVGNVQELLSHVHRAFHTYLAGYNEVLELEVRKRTRELTRAYDAQRESEERFRNLIEGSIQGILIHQDGKPCFANQAYAEIYGYDSPQDVLHVDDIFHKIIAPEDRDRLRHYYQSRLQGDPAPTHYNCRGLRRDGTMIWVENIITVVMWQGEPAIQCSVIDITERRRSDKERRRLEAQLRQAQKMEAVGTLAGGIAHDFNNMLSAIFGYTQLAQFEAQPGSTIANNLQEVLTAAGRARELVQQILTFSRQVETARQPIRLAPLIQEILMLLRASLPTTIDIRHILPEAGDMVYADPTQVHQVVMNLCVNAEHAMRETGGLLEIKVDEVEVDDDFVHSHPEVEVGPYVRLSVRDTGHGMMPSVLERIFDPFYTTKNVGDGTGMGLSMVHGILMGYGGAITVDSEPGAGTVFEVYFPRADVSSGQSASRDDIIPHGTGRILFVDDEPAISQSISVLLKMFGYDVVTCVRSREALDVFGRAPQDFDLVITDQTMPDLTGEQLAEEIRHFRPDVPIILCTGFSHLMNAEKARQKGIDAYLMKPLTAQSLATTIQQVFAARHPFASGCPPC